MLTLYKITKFIFRYGLPEPARYPAARAMARLVCLLNPPRRRVIVQNLTPLVGANRAGRLAPRLLGNFLMTAVDFFCPRRNLVAAMKVDNGHILEKTCRRAKRVMVVTAHCGNWEIGISFLVEKGYSVAGVYAPYRQDDIVRWIMSHRNPEVEWIVAARGASEACVSALQRGRVLGMVVDIPFAEKGHRVTIAGSRTHLPLGPWAIAVRAQAVVIPAFIVREQPGKYRLTFYDPITAGEGTFRRQIEGMQEVFRAHLERHLLAYPEQWGVLQPFWDPS